MTTPVVPYANSRISLVSKSNIRYEGTLYSIDPKEATVALANVRSFGTEDREAKEFVPPSNEQYEYIIFRGNDIQDLTVFESRPPVQPPMPNDPAIINSGLQMGQGAPPHYGMPFGQTPPYMMGPMGMPGPYGSQFGHYPGWAPGYGGYPQWGPQPMQQPSVPQQVQTHPPKNEPKGPAAQKPVQSNPASVQKPTAAAPAPAPVAAPAPAPAPNTDKPAPGPNPGAPHRSVAPASQPNQPKVEQKQATPTPAAQPQVPAATPAPTPVQLPPQPQTQSNSQELKKSSEIVKTEVTPSNEASEKTETTQPRGHKPREEKSAAKQQAWHQKSSNSGNSGASTSTNWRNTRGGTGNRGARGGGRGARDSARDGGGGGRGRGARDGGSAATVGANSRTKEQIQGDFDLELSTAAFDKEKAMKEIEETVSAKTAILKSDTAEKKPESAEEIAVLLASVDFKSAYNPSKSIFDTLSCEAFDKIAASSNSDTGKQKNWSDQRKIDTETFGETTRNRGGRGGGRGGNRGGRGGSRGRGHSHHHEDRGADATNENQNNHRYHQPPHRKVFRPVQNRDKSGNSSSANTSASANE